MERDESKTEVSDGLYELTALLGDLADQFECHAASRGIDHVEEAGRAMRAAKNALERQRRALERISLNIHGDIAPQVIAGAALRPTPN